MDFDPNISEEDIIRAYASVVSGIDKKAQLSDRAYGGVLRMEKGKMLEDITRHMVAIAWRKLEGDFRRISLDRKKLPVPIRREYVQGLPEELSSYINSNIERYVYRCGVDLHVCIDKKLVLGIECKAFAENAMMKRILVDFQFMKSIVPDMKCMLVQLESQLTGDYSSPGNPVTYGSHSTHTLLSHFPSVELDIVTLLEGERKINQPIHQHYKPLRPELLDKAIQRIAAILDGCNQRR